jgi:hypothetical protein
MAALPSAFVYSRYSDDITISSDIWIDADTTVMTVNSILTAEGFTLNESKTSCVGKGQVRTVTGIQIQPTGALGIGKTRKRDLEQKLYAYLIHAEGDARQIKGLIEFAEQVEPTYVAKLLSKYANYGKAKGIGVMNALT